MSFIGKTMRPFSLIPFLLAAATAAAPAAPAELKVLVSISFNGQETETRTLACGERMEAHTISVQGHSGSTEQQQAAITTRFDPKGGVCLIRIAPPLNPKTSDIDWFLPSWAVETQSDFERQMRFSATAEKGAAAALVTRRIDWFDPHRQPMNEFFQIGWIAFRARAS